ncbi:hypothetical protein DL89DRAFT_264067, partial [Linderina pennispora]
MLLQQQQQQQQQMRPGMVPQQQGVSASRRHTKAPGSVPQDEDSGDELDQFQPFKISLKRYQQNHSMMSDVFVALPTSTVEVPKHYYEELNEGA